MTVCHLHEVQHRENAPEGRFLKASIHGQRIRFADLRSRFVGGI